MALSVDGELWQDAKGKGIFLLTTEAYAHCWDHNDIITKKGKTGGQPKLDRRRWAGPWLRRYTEVLFCYCCAARVFQLEFETVRRRILEGWPKIKAMAIANWVLSALKSAILPWPNNCPPPSPLGKCSTEFLASQCIRSPFRNECDFVLLVTKRTKYGPMEINFMGSLGRKHSI